MADDVDGPCFYALTLHPAQSGPIQGFPSYLCGTLAVYGASVGTTDSW